MTPDQFKYFKEHIFRRKTGEQRFWERVTIKGVDECWPWLAACNKHGYGILGGGGITSTAHRVSYELAHGPIGSTYDLCVLHRCDNPPCVNPNHLFLGTRADNIADMTQKGRLASFEGTLNVRAILTEDQVKTILASLHRTNVDLGKEYGVSQTTISAIRIGKNWSHLPRENKNLKQGSE